MRIFVLFIFLSDLIRLNGQEETCPCQANSENHKIHSALIGHEYIDKNQNNPLQFFTDWSKGEVIFTSGESAENEFLLYNMLLDEVIWMRATDYKKVILDRRFVREFIVQPKKTPQSVL